MRSGIVIGAISVVGWIVMDIYDEYSLEWVWFTFLIWPTNWACLMMIIGLLLFPEPRAKWWMQLRRITIALFIILAAIICIAIILHPSNDVLRSITTTDSRNWQRDQVYEELAAKIGWVIGLLANGGALFVWLAAAFLKPVAREALTTIHSSYWLSCPRCGLEQQAMTGSDNCDKCNLQIKVELA